MKKTAKKVLAAVLSCSIVAGSVTYGVLADKADDAQNKVTSIFESINKDDTMSERYQNETVYVISNNDGNTQKVIVSDTLKDNTNGTESYSMQNVDAEAPIAINVKYELDGKAVNASEIAGKSGHVSITYDYTNNITSKVMVGDKEETMYVPFAVVTGMLLDNEKFSNVSVTGGKLIDDGTRKAVVSNLTMNQDEAGNLFDGALNQVTDVMDQLLDGSLQLADGATQLHDGLVTAADGAKTLADGSKTAYDGSAALAEGAKSAYEGSSALAEGAGSAYTGAKTLDGGIGTLKEGLDTLNGNSAALTGGAKQVFATLLSTADASLKSAGLEVPALTIENYSTVIDGVITNLNKTDASAVAKAKVEAQVKENRGAVEAAVTEAVKAEGLEQILNAAGMDTATYQAAVAAGKLPAETKAQIEGALAAQLKTEQVKAIIEKNTNDQCELLVKQYMASDDVKAQIAAGEKTIKESVASLQGLKASLDSYNTFYQGIIAYTNGVASAASGADQLKTGANTLAGGLKTLSDGTASLESGLKDLSAGAAALEGGLKDISEGNASLSSGLVELRDGSEKLAEGADTLHSGLAALNDEAVSKLVDFVNNNLSEVGDRLNAIAQVSADYKSINGLNGAEDGSVKFIYKTGEVK